MEHIALTVAGMSCEHCETTIKAALMKLNGISSVVIDLGLKRVLVELDSEKVSLDVIKGTIEDQGYEVK